MADSDLVALRMKMPFLKDFSDAFIRSTKPECLLKMEATSMKMKELEFKKDAEEKLANNRAALGTNPTPVKDGVDDRWLLLHPARFLPGAGCSAAKLWLAARESIGLTGAPPLGNYDMNACGLGGFVTAKGWVELANPASARMTIRYFNINNCNAKASTHKPDGGDSLMAEFTEIGEFKLALRTLRTAAMFVMPWNFSYVALENFLISNQFCRDDIGSLDKQAALLTSFTDYILAENASRWRNAEPFLAAGDLKTAWQSFFSARPQAALARKAQAQQQLQQPARNKQNQQAARATPPPAGNSATNRRLPFIPVCYNWNRNICPKPDGSCISRYNVPLQHVCDHRPNPANLLEYCGQAHRRVTNH
jgi:hypothetical protein